MKINRVIIKNYRNLKDIDVQLENLVAVVGENNSGKSNFLNAITLPLASEDGGRSKRLSWQDINNEAKDRYYRYIKESRNSICKDTIDKSEFANHIPSVNVSIEIEANETEHYDIKDLISEMRDGKQIDSIRYCWSVEKSQDLLLRVKEILDTQTDVENAK